MKRLWGPRVLVAAVKGTLSRLVKLCIANPVWAILVRMLGV